MGKHIGRLEGAGVDTQPTRNTPAVSPKFTIPFTKCDLQNVIDKVIDEGATGVIGKNQTAIEVGGEGKGSIAFNVDHYNLIPFLSVMTGENYKNLGAGVDNGNGTYSHEFNVQENSEHTALTIFSKDSNLGEQIFDLAMANVLTLKSDSKKLTELNVDFISKLSENTGPFSTPCIGNRKLGTFANTYVKFGADLTTLGTNLQTKSLTMTVNKNLEADYYNGSLTPDDINNQSFTVDIDLEVSYKDRAMYDLYRDNIQRACEIGIDVGNNEGVKFQMKNINFSEYSKNMSNDNIVTQKIKATMVVNCESDYFKAILTNTIEDLSTI